MTGAETARYDRPRGEGEPDPWAFFAERGFALVDSEGDGAFWVDLVALDNPDFTLRRYGSGGDAERAAYAAMRRWIVEQAT